MMWMYKVVERVMKVDLEVACVLHVLCADGQDVAVEQVAVPLPDKRRRRITKFVDGK
jgi:hypothetical protein